MRGMHTGIDNSSETFNRKWNEKNVARYGIIHVDGGTAVEVVCCRRRGIYIDGKIQKLAPIVQQVAKRVMEGAATRFYSRARIIYSIAVEGLCLIAQHQLSLPDGDEKVGGFGSGRSTTSRRRWNVNIEVWGALMVSHWQWKGVGNDLRMVAWRALAMSQNNDGSQDHNRERERRQHIVVATIRAQLRMNVMDVF